MSPSPRCYDPHQHTSNEQWFVQFDCIDGSLSYSRTIAITLNTLNFHHLRYFWAVARAGNLTRASSDLHITPQTVSTQLRELEAAMGVALFERAGRGLALTEAGRRVFAYAEEIFRTGQDLVASVAAGGISATRLLIGIADVVPKLVAYRLIEPALRLDEPTSVVCREGATTRLLADLSVHALDVVLSDSPIPPTVRIRAFNHLLGECEVVLMAAADLALEYRRGFPGSLNGAPFLLPQRGTMLRQSLEVWFATNGIHPRVVGEFDDSALLKVFGQSGAGVFAVPSVMEREVRQQYGARRVGPTEGLVERFYAISVQRKIQHPAVAAICDTARTKLFG